MNPTREMVAQVLQEKLKHLTENYQDELQHLTNSLAKTKRENREKEDLLKITELQKELI